MYVCTNVYVIIQAAQHTLVEMLLYLTWLVRKLGQKNINQHGAFDWPHGVYVNASYKNPSNYTRVTE